MENIDPLVPGENLEAQWKKLKWQFQGVVEFDAVRAKWSAEVKAQALIHAIGLQCEHLYSDASQDTRADVKLLIAHIDKSVKPVRNECFERFAFRQLVREDGEDVQQYVSRCRERLARCGIPAEPIQVKTLAEEMFIIDSLVHNLNDLPLQQLLFSLKKEDLTLAKVVDTIQVHEAGKTQMKEIQSCRTRLGAVSLSNPTIAPVYAAGVATADQHHSRPSRSPSTGHHSRSRSNWKSRSRSRSHSRDSSRSSKSRYQNKKQSKSYRARSPTPHRRQ